MLTDIEFHSPIDDHFLRLEPVVVVGDDLFVKTRGADDGVIFVTARGVEHPLRRLCCRGTLVEHLIHHNACAARQRLQVELVRLQAASHLDELRYFVEYLLPAFSGRDWSDEFRLDTLPHAGTTPEPGAIVPELDTLCRSIPAPALPSPSCLVLGRFWFLEPMESPAGIDHVRSGQRRLGPTGEHITTGLLERQWREEVRGFLARQAARLAELAQNPTVSAALSRARAEVAQLGFLRRGDLLFLAGSPPRVGHVLPPHYNRALGRESRHDLAMTAPLTLPPLITTTGVYTRDSSGQWIPLQLPHGLCLGGSPPEIRPETPGLALLAYLRWAACRIASNGAFHASDDHHEVDYDYSY